MIQVTSLTGTMQTVGDESRIDDDGALHGRLHLSALSKKSRLHIDDHGLVVESEEHPEPLLRLGERYPCRLRGLDLWTGKLDLAPV